MASPKGVVRELFSLGLDDRDRIQAVIRRGESLGIVLNKSEVVRAGIQALLKLPSDAFLQAIGIERFRPGPNPKEESPESEEEREAFLARVRLELGLD